MAILINMAVWGDSYIKAFIDVSLPSQLSEGNLGQLKGRSDCRYHIFTTEEGREKIESSEPFQDLKKILPVDFFQLGDSFSENKYYKWAQCNKITILEANRLNAAVIFFNPDAIYSDGMFKILIDAMQQGKRVVVCSGVRLMKESFLKNLAQHRKEFQKGKTDLTLPPRILTSFALKHLHPISESLFWEQEMISTWPSNLYWRLDDETLLIRAFHLHPILIWPEKKNVLPHTTIDDVYLGKVCPSRDKWKIITDSDEFAAFEMSSESEAPMIYTDKKDLEKVALWAFTVTKPYHWKFFQTPIFLHSKDKNSSWALKIQACNDEVDKILRFLNHPPLKAYLRLSIKKFPTFYRILRFLYNFARRCYGMAKKILRRCYGIAKKNSKKMLWFGKKNP